MITLLVFFSTFTQFFITFIQTFYYFLFVELLNPLCLVLDTDPLQCNSGKKKPRNMCMIIALFHLFHTMWWNGIKWVLSSGGISRHSVLYLLQDNNNGRQSCVHANFEPDELQKTIDLHTCMPRLFRLAIFISKTVLLITRESMCRQPN